MKKQYLNRESGIWTLEAAKKRHRFDKQLAHVIGRAYKPALVADVGCGNGAYCKFLSEEYGWKIHGYEGTQDIASLGIYDDIMILDLSVRRYVDIPYDLVICLEVGEHIPQKYEQAFLDNLADFTTKDLVMSWAIPGQGGFGHFNEQLNGYIIYWLEKRGLKLDMERSAILRKYATLKWFKETLMVFSK